MKKLASSIFIVSIALLSSFKAEAQTANPRLYAVLPDSAEGKYFKGIIPVNDIVSDTSFKWYAENLKFYKPNAGLVQSLKEKQGKFQLVLFTGTWCHDSQQIVPKYLSCLKAAAVPETCLTIFGTDRHKSTLANMSLAFNVTLVPTMIVMQDGKEVGRVVEYGTTGLPDQELADLLKKI